MRRHMIGTTVTAAGIALSSILIQRLVMPDAMGGVGPSSDPPTIRTAYFGYNNCIGVPDSNGNGSNVDEAQAQGCRTVNIPHTTTLVTNAAPPSGVSNMCLPAGSVSADQLKYLDGLPVTFSGHVNGSSVTNSAFTVTLSDGSKRNPSCVSLNPSNEANESETVLLMGNFGEPQASGKPYPTSVTVSGVQVLSSNGTHVTMNTTSVAVMNYSAGPKLLAAKVAPFSTTGEGTTGRGMPNHCRVNFPTTTHVIQLLWSGGVTRDGVNSIFPNESGLFKTATTSGLFNIKVRKPDGTQTDYFMTNGVQILGIADVGNGLPTEGQFWPHDADNYLDICLALPAGFDLSTISKVVTDPNNQAGLKLYDPSGDTPNSGETVTVTR